MNDLNSELICKLYENVSESVSDYECKFYVFGRLYNFLSSYKESFSEITFKYYRNINVDENEYILILYSYSGGTKLFKVIVDWEDVGVSFEIEEMK